MSGSITIEELVKYKNKNTDILPQLIDYINSIKKIPVTFKRFESVKNTRSNWILNKKLTQDENEKLVLQYRSILNKLSDSNFNELADELVSVQIKTQEQLAKLVETVFIKAISETKFVEIYAKLSKELSSYYVEEGDKKVYFRELLINRCQNTFNRGTSYDKSDDNDVNNSRMKQEILGCITFIGELYKYEMLTSKIINSCFIHLFTRLSLNKAYIVDCLCTLFKIVGKDFFTKSPDEANNCINKLDKLKSSQNIQLKEKFAIMDIIDLATKKRW